MLKVSLAYSENIFTKQTILAWIEAFLMPEDFIFTSDYLFLFGKKY